MTISIIYTFRNRDSRRIKKSLDSLAKQVAQNFKVFFVDYGSDANISQEIKNLLDQYEFATYIYLYTNEQPWNKCKALNYIVKDLKSGYCFTADADIIFDLKFTQKLEKFSIPNTATYFQVGFLDRDESLKDLLFEKYKIKFLSKKEATGLTLFPVEKLKLVNGFDEFFHFWGAEDTDVHNRLKNTGCEVVYYDSEVLLLHQWHKNYRSRETRELNKELQLSGIVEVNHKHLVYNLENRISKVNLETWGKVLSYEEFNELKTFQPKQLSTEKSIIDHFLYFELPNVKEKIIGVTIKRQSDHYNAKYKFKKLLGKKIIPTYTLKEVNDLLLMHIISCYQNFPYSYQISEDLNSITFKIKKL